MFAVIAIFNMAFPPVGQHGALDGIVDRVSKESGYVTGYWTHDGKRAYNVMIFTSREAAEHRAEDVRGNAENQIAWGIVPVEITVAEVLAHA